MRNKLSVILFIAVSTCLLVARPGVDVTGTWTGEVRGQEGGTGKVRFVLQQEGDRISGAAGPVESRTLGMCMTPNWTGIISLSPPTTLTTRPDSR
jgi:hypothetical protein